MQISACDAMRRLRLVKATASPEARGFRDAKRAGQGHSKKLEWLASGRVGNRREDGKIVDIIGGKVPRLITILQLSQYRGAIQEGHGIPMRCAIRAGPNKMSGRASISCRIGQGSIWRKILCGSYGEVS